MRKAGFLSLLLALALILPGLVAAEDSQPDRLQRARELSWSGDYEESLSLYQSILEQRPDDHALRREHGLVLLWAGREIDARRPQAFRIEGPPDVSLSAPVTPSGRQPLSRVSVSPFPLSRKTHPPAAGQSRGTMLALCHTTFDPNIRRI